MRKLTMISLAFVLALSSLVGCSSKESGALDPKNPVTIEVWTYYNGAQKTAFDTMVDEFNETVGKEKGIFVESSSSGGVNELIESIQFELDKPEGERELPDIFGCYSDTARDVDKEGLLVNLDNYMTEEELSEYVDAYIEEGRIGEDNSLKIFPVAKSTEVLMINKTDWEKFSKAAGASLDSFKTWESLIQLSKEYYEWTDSQTPEPDDGKAMFGRDSFANYINVGCAQLGEELFQVDKDVLTLNVNKEAMRRLWDNYYVPYISGYFASNGRFRSDDMKTGDLIALTGSSSSATYFPTEVTVEDNEPYPIESLVLEMPNFEGTEPYVVQQGAGMAVSKSNSAKEYASVEFLKWFTDTERNTKFSIESSYLPVKKAANDVSYIGKVVEENHLTWDQIVRDTVEVSISQCQNYTLYSSKPFKNGNDARNIINDSMVNKAMADREKVVELLNGGSGLDSAVAQINTDENFDQWFESMKTDLENTCAAE